MKPKILLLALLFAIMADLRLGHTQEHQLLSDNSHLKSPAQRNKRSVNQDIQTQYIVKTALFCDKECGEYFNNDRNKTLNYLLSLVLDANMHLTSLQSYILFVVTSFTQLNSTKDQPFVEVNRSNNGTITVTSILRPFGEWLHKNASKLAAFDYAILFTGSIGVDRSYSYSSSICVENTYNNVFWGASVVRLFIPSYSMCNTVAKSFAYAFGHSSTIKENNDHDNCWDKDYVFETNASACISEHKYFFSSCSNKIIGKYIFNRKAHCLSANKYESPPEYTMSYDAILTPTMTDQCKFACNRTDVFSQQNQENCLKTGCFEGTADNASFVKDMYPMANTRCGESKICFRGRCLSKGYRLQNFNNSNCFVSSNRFSYNDKPIISECEALSTPLDRLMIFHRGNHTFYLATPYSTPDAEENADKCLTIDYKYNCLMFDRCTENSSRFEWSFIKSNLDEQTFLLFHPSTQKCVTINQSSTFLYSTECNFNETSLKWKFLERHPSDLFVVTPTSAVLLTMDDSARLTLLSQKGSKDISPSSSDKFGIGVLVGILLTCVLGIGFFVSRHFVKLVKFRSSTNGHPTNSTVYYQEHNATLLENL